MVDMKIIFSHQEIGIVNGYYALITGLHIHKLNPQLEIIKKNLLEKINLTLDEEITKSLINVGYKDILREFGSEQLIPAGQNFVQMIKKRNKFPTINTVVDAYNSVVAESYLAIGAHDIAKIKGEISFDYAREGESIPAVNMVDVFKVRKGDYVYRDEEKILAWLDVKDTDLAKIDDRTTDVILIIEGNRNTTPEYIYSALQKSCQLIQEYNGGSYEISKIIDHKNI